MRDAMVGINKDRGNEDLLLKIGIHEGPCLAVTLNDRQDYFGQTVNMAARVQGLAYVACDLRHQAGGRGYEVLEDPRRPMASRRPCNRPPCAGSPTKPWCTKFRETG